MRIRRLGLGVALLGMLAAACGGGVGGGSGGGGSAQAVPARNATTAPLLPTDVNALPSFDFDTYQTLLGQLKGTPVVVNIWASWCGPCRTEAPDLAATAKADGSRVQFLGIDILDARPAAVAFMKEFGWTYPSLFDATGEIRDRLGIIGQPATLFYDASGQVVATWVGPLTPQVLAKNIQKILP